MAIPGLRPTLEVRAKVRIGEKKKTAGGKEYPAAADHFICDDPDFLGTVGVGAKTLRVFLPFADNTQNFSTGLEWWRGKQLTCYSKGETIRGLPVAYRIESMVGAEDTILTEEKKGKERKQILCPVRDCPVLKKKDCKPMGRLQFFIDGIDQSKGVYQIDTKSWNTVEKIEGFLALHPDPRDIPFLLSVEMVSKGRDKYPVITLEADVEVNTPEDVAKADVLIEAIAELNRALTEEGPTDLEIKQAMAGVLDLRHPDWRDNERLLAAMKERIENDGLLTAGRLLLKSVTD